MAHTLVPRHVGEGQSRHARLTLHKGTINLNQVDQCKGYVEQPLRQRTEPIKHRVRFRITQHRRPQVGQPIGFVGGNRYLNVVCLRIRWERTWRGTEGASAASECGNESNTLTLSLASNAASASSKVREHGCASTAVSSVAIVVVVVLRGRKTAVSDPRLVGKTRTVSRLYLF